MGSGWLEMPLRMTWRVAVPVIVRLGTWALIWVGLT